MGIRSENLPPGARARARLAPAASAAPEEGAAPQGPTPVLPAAVAILSRGTGPQVRPQTKPNPENQTMKTLATKTKKTLNLDKLVLDSGSHSSLDKGMCIMEAVAFMAGESHSDHPACASPVISAFLRRWNDRVTDEERQDLKRYIPLLLDSRGSLAVERKRAWLATDWSIRVAVPAYLENAKLKEHAQKLAGLPEITDRPSWEAAKPLVVAAREASRKKYYAAYAYADAYADAAAAADAAYAAAYAAADAAYAAADAYAAAAKKVRAVLTASAHGLVERMLALKD